MTDPSPETQICLVDGRVGETLPPDDRGLAYGDGLFETIRFRGNHTPLWPRHWQRLHRGAQVLGLSLDYDLIRHHLDRSLALAAERSLEQGVVKLMVTRGSGGRGYLPPPHPANRTICIVNPYRSIEMLPGSAVELKSCDYRLSYNTALAGLKHLNRLEQVLAANALVLSRGQQGLLFDQDGRLIETLHHNLFLVCGGVLVTPDLSRCGVAGTLRQAVLDDFAPAAGIDAQIRDLGGDDLHGADEVFICNAVHGLTPVIRWQDRAWSPGPVTRRLQQMIAREWNNFYGG